MSINFKDVQRERHNAISRVSRAAKRLGIDFHSNVELFPSANKNTSAEELERLFEYYQDVGAGVNASAVAQEAAYGRQVDMDTGELLFNSPVLPSLKGPSVSLPAEPHIQATSGSSVHSANTSSVSTPASIGGSSYSSGGSGGADGYGEFDYEEPVFDEPVVRVSYVEIALERVAQYGYYYLTKQLSLAFAYFAEANGEDALEDRIANNMEIFDTLDNELKYIDKDSSLSSIMYFCSKAVERIVSTLL